MLGNRFEKFDPRQQGKTRFEQMLDLFMQMLSYTNGDAGEAMRWMNELDKKYQLTDDEYGMGDFIDELKEKGYLTEENETGEIKITPKTEQGIRKRSLEEIFGKLKKTRQGNHQTFKPGQGDEINPRRTKLAPSLFDAASAASGSLRKYASISACAIWRRISSGV